jgi:hypothetical protein
MLDWRGRGWRKLHKGFGRPAAEVVNYRRGKPSNLAEILLISCIALSRHWLQTCNSHERKVASPLIERHARAKQGVSVKRSRW